MKNYKHSQRWYENVHDALVGFLLIGGFIAIIIVCGLLENI